ncbi:C-terminal of Roc (COR) domain-containing protein [Candidatus Electrothrix laxa]
MQETNIIRQIEQILGKGVTLHPAPAHPTLLDGVMAFKEGQPKYALDEQGRLIGLNLAATGLDDKGWQAIVDLLEEYEVWLQALNLCKNQLKKFVPPPGIAELISLDLEDNPLEYPSPETLKQGTEAVLRFLQAAEVQGLRDAFEVKMLIVGEGETGKTTLWNLLQNPDHPVPDKRQKSTVGIQIKEGWEFQHLDRPDDTFYVNLWDFGGQEIQYMTHQFFLTRRSFYVLLADARREAANFPYWLDIINLLGRDPEEEAKLPVLVVLNEKGNRNPKMPYDPEIVEEQYPGLEIIKRDIDFQEKEDRRLESLTRTIQEILCRQIAHLPIKIPRLWDEVRAEIKSLQKTKNHICHEQFVQICTQHGLTEREQQDDISQLFHDLGLILHFREPTLEDFIVLNPEWAVNAVYTILENDDVKDINQGRFNQELLRMIWTEKGFSAEERGKLLNLMLKDGLEVCFRATENNEEIFIAPQLLPEEPPKGICWTDSSTTLRYVYHYPFMPKGIIGRLIVRLHEDIEQCEEESCACGDWRKMVWKNGVYLRKDGCRARVRYMKEREQGREIIRIEVQGKEADERKHVLREICKELDAIHKDSFPSLKVFQKIPCNCEECRYSVTPCEYDNAKLENLKNNRGKDEVQCGGSGDMVSIRQIQDGVFGQFSAPDRVPHSPVPVPSPVEKPWWIRWWIWIAAAVGFIGSIASIIGLL